MTMESTLDEISKKYSYARVTGYKMARMKSDSQLVLPEMPGINFMLPEKFWNISFGVKFKQSACKLDCFHSKMKSNYT